MDSERYPGPAGLAFCLTVALEQNLRLQGENATNIRQFYPQTRRVGFRRSGSRLILGLSVIVSAFSSSYSRCHSPGF